MHSEASFHPQDVITVEKDGSWVSIEESIVGQAEAAHLFLQAETEE